jgi:prepilin-type N-terminal cleavage/methylation domain-containing protein
VDRQRASGFTIVEVLIVLAIVAVLAAIAIPELHKARVRAEVGALAGDARTLYMGFKQFYVDYGMYPNASDPPAFDLDTFAPLTTGKYYYRGNISRMLMSGRPDAYDSPDDLGANQEFWLEMTLSLDPAVRMVVANSNDAPLSGGEWLDGIYLYRDGVLSRL